MSMKTHMLAALREEFDQWEKVLASLSDSQIIATPQSGDMSIKDEIGHLGAWQLCSIARMEAGLHNEEPKMPFWWPDAKVIRADAETTASHEEFTDQINAKIHAMVSDQPWAEVVGQWRTGFLHFLKLSEAIPEPALLDPSRYAWLSGYSLANVIIGAYDHHQEHLEKVLERIDYMNAASPTPNQKDT